MGKRVSKVITRTGDDGTTGIADGSRLAKNDQRIHCLGEVDELNSQIGLAASFIQLEQIRDILKQLQHDLFDLGAELSQPTRTLMQTEHVDQLTIQAEQLNQTLPPLQEFILPAGSTAVAQLHVARSVCRRVERSLVALNQQQAINPHSLIYLNRLSDLLFILARVQAMQTRQPEVYWQSSYSRIKPAQ
jgi:cob(I)alamin adenosyltransferase